MRATVVVPLATAFLLATGSAWGDVIVGNPLGDNVLVFDSTAIANGTPSLRGEFVKYASGGLHFPQALVLAPTDRQVYVASSGTDSILRYSSVNGAFLGAFVPTGSGGLLYPNALAFGPNNDLFVGQRFSNAILRYDGRTGQFLGVFAQSSSAEGIDALVFGRSGLLALGSRTEEATFLKHYQIDQFDAATGALERAFVPEDVLTPTTFSLFAGMTLGPNGDVFVTDSSLLPGDSRIMRFDGTTGALINPAVYEVNGQAFDLAYGSDQRLYIGLFEVTENSLRGVIQLDLITGIATRFGDIIPASRGIAVIGTLPEPTGSTFIPLGVLAVALALSRRQRTHLTRSPYAKGKP